MNSHEVYKQSEQYKRGWVHGFYDCTADDGGPYGRPFNAEELRGYLDGTAVRLSAQMRLQRKDKVEVPSRAA